MPDDGAKLPPAPTEFQILQAEINALNGGNIASYTGEEVAMIYQLFLKKRETELKFQDNPGRRAHAMNVYEFRLKVLVSVCLTMICVSTVGILIFSAKSDDVQEKRTEKILQIIPGVLGGLGGGWALGKSWGKPKEDEKESSAKD